MIIYLFLVVILFAFCEIFVMCNYRTVILECVEVEPSEFKKIMFETFEFNNKPSLTKEWRFKKDLGRKKLTVLQHMALFLLCFTMVFVVYFFLAIDHNHSDAQDAKTYKAGETKTVNSIVSFSKVDKTIDDNDKKTGNKFLDFLRKEI